MRNGTILVIILISIMPLASADVLIEMPQQDVNLDNLQKNFEIGFVNTGSQTVNLTFNTSSTTDIQIEHPEKIILKPSEITSSPEGSDWYYLGDNKYAEIQHVNLKSTIPLDTDTRAHNFKLAISRVYKTDRRRPNVEKVQEFGFEIFSTSDTINTGFQSSEDEKQDQKTSKDTDIEEPQENIDRSDNVSGTSPQIENNTSDKKSPQSTDKDSVNNITILLILGIILLVVWMFKEVLM